MVESRCSRASLVSDIEILAGMNTQGAIKLKAGYTAAWKFEEGYYSPKYIPETNMLHFFRLRFSGRKLHWTDSELTSSFGEKTKIISFYVSCAMNRYEIRQAVIEQGLKNADFFAEARDDDVNVVPAVRPKRDAHLSKAAIAKKAQANPEV
jgi:hypothetical protein